MKVLTFGWDFPPARNGGLGVACFGLTRELAQEGVEVIFVLPKKQEVTGSPCFIFADVNELVKVREVPSWSTPYHASGSEYVSFDSEGNELPGRSTLIEQVHLFAHRAAAIAQAEAFDLIHAHDWTSYLAGMAAKGATGKPLVLHVHATSFDQAGSDSVDPEIFKIECEAFAFADQIVTVSELTKNVLVEKHGVDPDKIKVVHNGSDTHEPVMHPPTLIELKNQGKKIVLYHGRITIQKGVDYFVRAAKRVLDVYPNVVFVISGWGDSQHQIMQQVGSLGLSSNFIFAGSLWEDERDRMYQSADLVVMPSVSEPFGLVPLEAMQHGTPSVISKQSGVGEVVSHVLKVDFWDVDAMANKIVAALKYPALNQQLVSYGKGELLRLSWHRAAGVVKEVYHRLLQLGRSKE